MALPLRPSHATGPDQPLRFSMALLLRPYHAQRFIHQKVFYPNPTKNVQAIFTAKPTGPDQRLRFSMALPLRPSMRSPPDQTSMAHPLRSFRPQRFIHQKLHAIRTKMLKHLHSEGHWTRSAVEVQHVSSPQAISPAALHPSEASRKSDKNV